MTEKIDIEKVKQQLVDSGKLWGRKLGDLKHQVERQGAAGIGWWLKTHKQVDKLSAAMQQLAEEAKTEDFSLDRVEQVFADFLLPEEDLVQANWYTAAHLRLEEFLQQLKEKQKFDPKKLEAALKELRFIGDADEFHQRYGLETLQHKVKVMYQELSKELESYKKLEKEKLAQQKEQDELEKARLEKEKAEAEAKKAMAKNIAIKEKRLAIIEEKKRQIAAKEAAEAEQRKLEEAAEIEARQAEIRRQEKLQESYIELQMEEKLNRMPLEELVEFVKKQIEGKSILTFVQQDQLEKLKQIIDTKTKS